MDLKVSYSLFAISDLFSLFSAVDFSGFSLQPIFCACLASRFRSDDSTYFEFRIFCFGFFLPGRNPISFF